METTINTTTFQLQTKAPKLSKCAHTDNMPYAMKTVQLSNDNGFVVATATNGRILGQASIGEAEDWPADATFLVPLDFWKATFERLKSSLCATVTIEWGDKPTLAFEVAGSTQTTQAAPGYFPIYARLFDGSDSLDSAQVGFGMKQLEKVSAFLGSASDAGFRMIAPSPSAPAIFRRSDKYPRAVIMPVTFNK